MAQGRGFIKRIIFNLEQGKNISDGWCRASGHSV
jgi:hypothetical protein